MTAAFVSRRLRLLIHSRMKRVVLSVDPSDLCQHDVTSGVTQTEEAELPRRGEFRLQSDLRCFVSHTLYFNTWTRLP